MRDVRITVLLLLAAILGSSTSACFLMEPQGGATLDDNTFLYSWVDVSGANGPGGWWEWGTGDKKKLSATDSQTSGANSGSADGALSTDWVSPNAADTFTLEATGNAVSGNWGEGQAAVHARYRVKGPANRPMTISVTGVFNGERGTGAGSTVLEAGFAVAGDLKYFDYYAKHAQKVKQYQAHGMYKGCGTGTHSANKTVQITRQAGEYFEVDAFVLAHGTHTKTKGSLTLMVTALP